MNDSRVGQLFVQYADDVHKFLVYFTKTYDVDDLVQDTFVKAFRALYNTQNLSNPKGWLLSIARHVAIDHLRKTKRGNGLYKDTRQGVVGSEHSLEQQVEFRDFQRQLLSILDHVKPNYRQVIICRAVMDMSVEETAIVLGWTMNRVNVTLHRGLKMVRTMLNEDGIGG